MNFVEQSKREEESQASSQRKGRRGIAMGTHLSRLVCCKTTLSGIGGSGDLIAKIFAGLHAKSEDPYRARYLSLDAFCKNCIYSNNFGALSIMLGSFGFLIHAIELPWPDNDKEQTLFVIEATTRRASHIEPCNDHSALLLVLIVSHNLSAVCAQQRKSSHRQTLRMKLLHLEPLPIRRAL